jgi:hypothetical protein
VHTFGDCSRQCGFCAQDSSLIMFSWKILLILSCSQDRSDHTLHPIGRACPTDQRYIGFDTNTVENNHYSDYNVTRNITLRTCFAALHFFFVGLKTQLSRHIYLGYIPRLHSLFFYLDRHHSLSAVQPPRLKATQHPP